MVRPRVTLPADTVPPFNAIRKGLFWFPVANIPPVNAAVPEFTINFGAVVPAFVTVVAPEMATLPPSTVNVAFCDTVSAELVMPAVASRII